MFDPHRPGKCYANFHRASGPRSTRGSTRKGERSRTMRWRKFGSARAASTATGTTPSVRIEHPRSLIAAVPLRPPALLLSCSSAWPQAARLPWACLDYRHTFGSQLAVKGESLYKISTLMGNSPEICRRHYAAVAPDAMTTTVEFPQMEILAQRAV